MNFPRSKFTTMHTCFCWSKRMVSPLRLQHERREWLMSGLCTQIQVQHCNEGSIRVCIVRHSIPHFCEVQAHLWRQPWYIPYWVCHYSVSHPGARVQLRVHRTRGKLCTEDVCWKTCPRFCLQSLTALHRGLQYNHRWVAFLCRCFGHFRSIWNRLLSCRSCLWYPKRERQRISPAIIYLRWDPTAPSTFWIGFIDTMKKHMWIPLPSPRAYYRLYCTAISSTSTLQKVCQWRLVCQVEHSFLLMSLMSNISIRFDWIYVNWTPYVEGHMGCPATLRWILFFFGVPMSRNDLWSLGVL